MRARLIAPKKGIMTVFDDGARKTVAKAMYKPAARAWLLHIYGGCWIDPRARAPSPVTGGVNPEYMLVRGKIEALGRMQELVAQINSA